MRRLIAAMSAFLALSGASVAFAPPASAVAISGLCGSNSKLWGNNPYNDDTIIQHFITTRGYLKCGPYGAPHQWKVNVQLQQYYGGAWHVVSSATSAWKTAAAGTVNTRLVSVYCLGHTSYKFRAHSTGYYRASSAHSTRTLGSTYSSTVTLYC